MGKYAQQNKNLSNIKYYSRKYIEKLCLDISDYQLENISNSSLSFLIQYDLSKELNFFHEERSHILHIIKSVNYKILTNTKYQIVPDKKIKELIKRIEKSKYQNSLEFCLLKTLLNLRDRKFQKSYDYVNAEIAIAANQQLTKLELEKIGSPSKKAFDVKIIKLCQLWLFVDRLNVFEVNIDESKTLELCTGELVDKFIQSNKQKPEDLQPILALIEVLKNKNQDHIAINLLERLLKSQVRSLYNIDVASEALQNIQNQKQNKRNAHLNLREIPITTRQNLLRSQVDNKENFNTILKSINERSTTAPEDESLDLSSIPGYIFEEISKSQIISSKNFNLILSTVSKKQHRTSERSGEYALLYNKYKKPIKTLKPNQSKRHGKAPTIKLKELLSSPIKTIKKHTLFKSASAANASSHFKFARDHYAKEIANSSTKIAYQLNFRELRRYLGDFQALQMTDIKLQFSKEFNKIPQPTNPKGVVFIGPTTNMGYIRLPHMALLEAKKNGYAVLSLTEGFLPRQKTGNKSIDQFSGYLTQNMHFRIKNSDQTKMFFEWDIDFERKKAICCDINFHEQFSETLRILRRNYTINWKDLFNQDFINKKLISTDHGLKTCFEIKKNLSDKGIAVRLLMTDMSTVPIASFRSFCDKYGEGVNFHFVQSINSYESFYNDDPKDRSRKMSVQNLTLVKNRSAYLAPRAQFENWIKVQNEGKVLSEVENLILSRRKNPPSKSLVPYRENIISKLKHAQSQGTPIICLMGKIVFDLSVPYDGGNAHDSFKDWLNHSIEVAKKSNILLLIKPHPHEMRQEIVMWIAETFYDLIEEKNLPVNIIFLDHQAFTTFELFPYVDMVTMWNGSSCLEFGTLNVPTVICSHFGKIDYPVPLLYPKNRLDYEEILQNPSAFRPSKNLRLHCAGLIKYTETEENSIPYEYLTRNRSNKNSWPPKWHEDQITDYMKNGDKNVTIITERIIDGM